MHDWDDKKTKTFLCNGLHMQTLKNLKVLVTRPKQQTELLCQGIRERGGIAIAFPTIEIVEVLQVGNLKTRLKDYLDCEIAVFTSANAVEVLFHYLKVCSYSFPVTIQCAAVGEATARKLQEKHVKSIFPSKTFNSEALLEIPLLKDVAGKKISLFRGEGGRKILAQELKKRGGLVNEVVVYKREQPHINILEWLPTLREIDVIVVTSSEGLHNFAEMTDAIDNEWIKDKQLLVISPRIKTVAEKMGFTKEPLLATEASDHAIISCLESWLSTRKTT